MKKVKDYLSIIRPVNSLMIGLAVVIGEIVGLKGQLPTVLLAVTGFLTGFLISASSMAFNDYFDLEVDRVNAPDRPLPSGRLTEIEAIGVGVFCGATGCIISSLIGIIPLLIALSFWAVGFSYDWIGKRLSLIGNTMVSSSVAIPFIFGGVAVNEVTLTILILFLMSFLANMSREVIKGIIDMEGDRVKGYVTLALEKGERFASLTAFLFLITSVILSPTPYLIGEMGEVYLLFIAIADLVMILASIKIIKARHKENFRRIKGIILAGMFLGLISFLFGSLSSQ